MIAKIVDNKLTEIINLLKSKKVKNAYIFGSACREDFKDDSDIDFLIKFDDNLDYNEYGQLWWEIYFGLEDLLHKKIDIINEDKINNPYLKREINKNKIKII